MKTRDKSRLATLEDADFLGRVANGLAIRKRDIFTLRVRQDAVVKNGRTSRRWTVLQVVSHRRAADEGDLNPLTIVPAIVAATTGASHITKREASRS